MRLKRTTDGLKIHLALSGKILIPLVAAITFLAALMISGAYAAQTLANRWNTGAASTVILQIPNTDDPDQATTPSSSFPTKTQNAISEITRLLASSKALNSFHTLNHAEINELLKPWLHQDLQSLALSVPIVIELHLKEKTSLPDQLRQSLQQIVPDIIIEQSNFWGQRFNALANSLQTCAFLALIIVICVAATVIAIATRTGMIQCKPTIKILSNLGASDYYISTRFAKRSAILTFTGGCIGSMLSIPLLLFLTYLSLPFSSDPNWENTYQGGLTILTLLPLKLLILFLFLPIFNACIGWLATTMIVHFWLKHMM